LRPVRAGRDRAARAARVRCRPAPGRV